MDLTKENPRPGWDRLGGYPWLPRAIDKCRASLIGKLGDYIFPCPIDRELFAELDITSLEFIHAVESAETDEEVLDAIGLSEVPGDPRIEKWAREFLENRHDSLKSEAEEEGRVWNEVFSHPV